MGWLRLETWSPYVVGIGIGMLSWLTFLLSDKPLGCSTSFAQTFGMLEKFFRGKGVVEKRAYHQKVAPVIDWQWMLVLGIVIGAFLSSILSGTFRFEMVPSRWVAHFGHTPGLRFIVALMGGVFMGLGSRWASGCTSGHGISGTLQMAISSWLAVVCFFIAGIVMAVIIYS
jgi:uncharacterized membrane protein YedE/YeeE